MLQSYLCGFIYLGIKGEMMRMNERRYTVYMHTNKINHKVYVGITSQNIMHRWGLGGRRYLKKENGRYKHRKFAPAILKYGWDNFEHIVFAENVTVREAKQMERILVALYDSFNNGYNSTKGGDGSVGNFHSEETKRKISQNHADLSGDKNPNYGKKMSEEQKKKISESKKGKCIGKDNPTSKKIIRLSDKKIFDSLTIAANNAEKSTVTLRKYCKKHKEWMYFDEYKSLSVNE